MFYNFPSTFKLPKQIESIFSDQTVSSKDAIKISGLILHFSKLRKARIIAACLPVCMKILFKYCFSFFFSLASFRLENAEGYFLNFAGHVLKFQWRE